MSYFVGLVGPFYCGVLPWLSSRKSGEFWFSSRIPEGLPFWFDECFLTFTLPETQSVVKTLDVSLPSYGGF